VVVLCLLVPESLVKSGLPPCIGSVGSRFGFTAFSSISSSKPLAHPVTVEGRSAGRLGWLNQSEWSALLQRPYFRNVVQHRQSSVRQRGRTCSSWRSVDHWTASINCKASALPLNQEIIHLLSPLQRRNQPSGLHPTSCPCFTRRATIFGWDFLPLKRSLRSSGGTTIQHRKLAS
jgi:hypothetical protein